LFTIIKIIFLKFETLTLEFLLFRKKLILEKLLEIAFHFEAKNDFFLKSKTNTTKKK